MRRRKVMINQALVMHPVFFDPLNKKVEIGEFGKPETIRYVEDPCGVRVEEDGSVSFAMYAPSITKVEAAGISGSFPSDRIVLEKDQEGWFRRTVKGIKPGFHYFNWYVDGVRIRDPQSPFCYGCFEPINFFEVPEPGEDFYYFKNVPHGGVEIRKYLSGENSHIKVCYVYTPPGYQREPEEKYPVLYLQHGVGENETGWIWNGKLNLILDNLIAEGKCPEMLVVMCSGYAFVPGSDPIFYPGDFDRELQEDVIPYIESHFRVRHDRESRAMAGLSLGSAQAALTVSRHPERFAYLGVFSGVAKEPVEKLLEEKEYKPRLVFLSCGNGETGLLKEQKIIGERMAQEEIRFCGKSYEGFHEWHVWRKSLRDFVQLLFQDKKAQPDDAPGAARPGTARSESARSERAEYPSELAQRQLAEENLLFFDPVFKQVIFATDESGRPAGRYADLPHGVEVTAPGEAVFRFFAPGAETVEVDVFGRKRFCLAPDRDMEGWWKGKISGISPGFHYHDYYVNGVRAVNPLAPVGYGAFRAIGFFEMPEENFPEYLPAQMPHGTVHMNYYPSSQTGRQKLCYVYTPPAYETDSGRRFPVLYLQHGGGENETGWLWQGKLDWIADHLLAEGRMRDMIVVMNTGYAFRPDGSSHPALGSFDEELAGDCIPFIDKHYRTIARREYRAMAGLSMGGMQTQRTVMRHPELFAWAGIFSGGLAMQEGREDYREVLLEKERFKERFRLLFVACGTMDGFYGQTRRNVERVLEAGVPLKYYEEDGYHDWTFWRHCLREFLPLLFDEV